jgi:hypothetical protein
MDGSQLLSQLASVTQELGEARARYLGLRLLETVHNQGQPGVSELAVSIRDLERRSHALRRAVSCPLTLIDVEAHERLQVAAP